jgi:hypothetical protein
MTKNKFSTGQLVAITPHTSWLIEPENGLRHLCGKIGIVLEEDSLKRKLRAIPPRHYPFFRILIGNKIYQISHLDLQLVKVENDNA